MNRQSSRQWLDQWCQPNDAAARRYLENAVGFSGRLILMVGVIVMVVCVLLACRWDFFEKVMYTMGRGIKQKKQEGCRAEKLGNTVRLENSVTLTRSHFPNTVTMYIVEGTLASDKIKCGVAGCSWRIFGPLALFA